MATNPSSSRIPNSRFSFGPRAMTSSLKELLARLTPNASSSDLPGKASFHKAAKPQLFPQTNPAVDGEDCLHDCASCTIRYPAKFSINESDELYGHIKGWQRHLIVATGKTDWVRDVADEKGSIMEAVDANRSKVNNGRLMLSASNIPLPENPEVEASTSCILLPAFTIIDNVTPKNTPDLINHIINNAPTNTSSLDDPQFSDPTISLPAELQLETRPCPHNYLILMCSQKTRDARCGQSAPLLRREFERHLRPLGLYRDLHDERPGGVGLYFISHVGGHKYSANVLVYRRAGSPGTGPAKKSPVTPPNETNGESEANGHVEKEEENQQAAQCIWLARVRPEDCENIIRYTVLQGKVVKPESQLRGGFNRGKQLISW